VFSLSVFFKPRALLRVNARKRLFFVSDSVSGRVRGPSAFTCARACTFYNSVFIGDLDDDDLQKTTKIEKKISNKKTQERREEKKRRKKEATHHKTELLCVFFFFFCKVRFPKAFWVVCALQVLLLRSIFFLESHQGNVETR
jgi:hypothetical protein